MMKEVVIPEVTVEWANRVTRQDIKKQFPNYINVDSRNDLIHLAKTIDNYQEISSIKPLKDDQVSYKEADELFYAFKEYDLIFILTYDGKYWRFSIPEESGQHFMEGHDSFIDCLEDALKKGHRVYQFSTQKELFIWGAEQLS